MKPKLKIIGTAILFVTAFIWGLGFPMQKMALEHVGAATLTCVRNLIAGPFLLLLIPIFDAASKSERRLMEKRYGRLRPGFTKKEVLGGILCGLLLGTATTLQQMGMTADETDSGKAAFITALYMVIVPFLGMLRKKFPSARIYTGVGVALLGSYLLAANIVYEGGGIGGFFTALKNSGFQFAAGDLLVLLCAFVFALHVFVIDLFSADIDGLRMSCIQFFVASLVTMPLMLTVERPSITGLLAAALPILYLGIFSSGIAYTGQIIGQKYVNVSVAPLILSLESVFGAICGAVLLHDLKTPIQILGCVIVFGAVVLTQLPSKKKKQ